MGFIIKYNRFFQVTFGEEGNDDPLQEFKVFPTVETHRKLRNYNLLFRPVTFGLDVYYSASPVIPITERICFTFGFTSTNTALFEKYGLVNSGESDPAVYQPGLCFDNLNDEGEILTQNPSSIVASGTGPDERVTAADTCRIYPQTFKVFDSAGEAVPANYILKHRYNSTLQQTVPVHSPEGANTIITTINSVDLGDDYISLPGPYLLEYGSDPTVTRHVYLNKELGQKPARGVIDIYWETSQNTIADANTGQIYKITFKPK